MTQQSRAPHSPLEDNEGLRDFPITHLVVGDPRALVLGRRVAMEGHSLVELRRGPRWGVQWQIGAVISVIGLVSVAALRTESGNARGLPVTPAAPSVRLVATAYVPEPAAPLPVADATQPLPFPLPPPLPAVAHPAKPLPQIAAKPPALHVPVQKKAAANEPARPAVVLDEAETRARSTAPDAGESPPQVAAVTAPAKGLIAITPDNKLAVFTNPRTGLPQQFHIGDPLPGGDTIRAIDGGQGKVFTSAREYSLD